MTRSRLRNKYLKTELKKIEPYMLTKKILCISTTKFKKKYYENERKLMDNKLFWKTIKSSFSDKIVIRD